MLFICVGLLLNFIICAVNVIDYKGCFSGGTIKREAIIQPQLKIMKI